MKKFKAYLKHFTPPIFRPNHFIEIYNRVFNKDKILHHFEYEKNFFKRHAFINLAISKFKNCKYLEIGVDDNDVFNSIPLSMDDKFGVDPKKRGNFKMTSDDFFEKNP